jgi:hypothetical protein
MYYSRHVASARQSPNLSNYPSTVSLDSTKFRNADSVL